MRYPGQDSGASAKTWATVRQINLEICLARELRNSEQHALRYM